MHCHLLVPGFDWPLDEAGARRDAPAPAALETLVARGRRSCSAAPALEHWLLERFGVERQRDWPAAPFSLIGDGGSPGTDVWICADPVHLGIERNRLMLADSAAFSVARDEAETLAGAINDHFGDTLRLYPMQAHRWYARLAACPDMETTPLSLARGGAIEAYLPRGPEAMRWQALANELQMLLHAHPVNAARETRGELPVNSVWLWGAGRLPPLSARPYQYVAASAPLARGLAQASGARSGEPAAHAQAWLAEAASRPGVVLIVLDALAAPSQYAQADAWCDALAQLERAWFAPLLAALRERRIGMLTLHLLGHAQMLQAEVVRSDLRRFWRRRRHLADWLA